MPRLEQILLVRPGHDVPEKTSVPLMTGWIFFLRVYLGAVPKSQGGAEREEKKVGDQAWSENILQIKSRNLFDKSRTWIDGFSDRVEKKRKRFRETCAILAIRAIQPGGSQWGDQGIYIRYLSSLDTKTVSIISKSRSANHLAAI